MSRHAAMPAQYREPQLADFQAYLQDNPVYPGYPERTRRLYLPGGRNENKTGTITIPDGPWQVHDDRSMRTDSARPNAADQLKFTTAGYRLDSLGRPLHPWFDRMVGDTALGILTGKGAYWAWGPNYTADGIVLHRDHVLLVERRDTGDWALPGGYVDSRETGWLAAPREVGEETGVNLQGVWNNQIYRGPVCDPRMTAHAWPETTAFLFPLDNSLPQPRPRGGDDARAAAWVPLDKLKGLELFGSHMFLIKLALGQLAALDLPKPATV